MLKNAHMERAGAYISEFFFMNFVGVSSGEASISRYTET